MTSESGLRETVDDRLHSAIKKLRQHVMAIQQAKRRVEAGGELGPNPILACVNDLPSIVLELEAAELEIEGAFERYEDMALISPAGEVAGWRPIETAPRDGTWAILLLLPDHEVGVIGGPVIGHWHKDCWDVPFEDGWFQDSHFTHWMPLPPPPTTGGKKDE